MLSLKQTFSGGCAHGQVYSDMKRKYVHDLCAVSVICSGRRVTVCLYSYDRTLHVDSPTLDQVELQPCHYSASVLHAGQPAGLPLNGEPCLGNFSYRENNIAAVFRG